VKNNHAPNLYVKDTSRNSWNSKNPILYKHLHEELFFNEKRSDAKEKAMEERDRR
jgi:hypothetical protein